MSIETRMQRLETTLKKPNESTCDRWHKQLFEIVLTNYGRPKTESSKAEEQRRLAELGEHPAHSGSCAVQKMVDDVVKNYGGLPPIENLEEPEVERTEIEWAMINRD